MAKEVERKFLVTSDLYKELGYESVRIRQGYLSRDKDRTVRVRLMDNQGYITVKGRTRGIERLEFEYAVPAHDAVQLLGLCIGRIIDKIRWKVLWKGKVWEVDVFQGDLEPLVVAEIELSSADEQIELPPFVGEDVSMDSRYFNSNL